MNKHCFIIGFSLLEVLIALVILSLAFLSVFSAISYNSRALFELQNKTAANWVALNVITEAQLGLIDLIGNEIPAINGEILFNQTWVWTSTEVESDLPGSYKVKISVKRASQSNPTLEVIAYLRKPV